MAGFLLIGIVLIAVEVRDLLARRKGRRK